MRGLDSVCVYCLPRLQVPTGAHRCSDSPRNSVQHVYCWVLALLVHFSNWAFVHQDLEWWLGVLGALLTVAFVELLAWFRPCYVIHYIISYTLQPQQQQQHSNGMKYVKESTAKPVTARFRLAAVGDGCHLQAVYTLQLPDCCIHPLALSPSLCRATVCHVG